MSENINNNNEEQKPVEEEVDTTEETSAEITEETAVDVPEEEFDSEKIMEEAHDMLENPEEYVNDPSYFGMTQEEYDELEKKYPIEWDKVEFHKTYTNLPILTKEDIDVLVLAKIMEKKEDVINSATLARNVIVEYYYAKNKAASFNDHDRLALENAKSYLARLQCIARQDGNKALSDENIYMQLRMSSYTRFLLYICKNNGQTLGDTIDAINERGFYYIFMNSILNNEKIFNEGYINIKNRKYLQEQYSRCMNDLYNPINSLYKLEKPLHLANSLLQTMFNGFINGIEFAKMYSLTQSQEKSQMMVNQIGAEEFAKINEHFKQFDKDGYYANNLGWYQPLFDSIDNNMILIDKLFIEHKDAPLLVQFAKDMKEYCLKQLNSMCKNAAEFAETKTALNKKFQENPDEMTKKDFEKLNNIEIYTQWYELSNIFLSDRDKYIRNYAHFLNISIYTGVFYKGLMDLFDFIDNSYNLPDIIDLDDEEIRKLTYEQFILEKPNKINSLKANTIKHAIMIDLNISINLINSDLALSNVEILDKITNKRYIEEAPNIKAFVANSRDASRKALAALTDVYVEKVFKLWTSLLNYDGPYVEWPLRIKLPSNYTEEEKKKMLRNKKKK